MADTKDPLRRGQKMAQQTSAQQSPGEQEPAKINPDHAEPLPMPVFQAGTVVLQTLGHEFMLIFQRARPAQLKSTSGLATQGVINEPVAAVALSPQTLKDLSLLLADAMVLHESEYGQVQTPFTKRRENLARMGDSVATGRA